jgi:hypothetical protein
MGGMVASTEAERWGIMESPEWITIGRLGDVDPIAHGGSFVRLDTTGHYGIEVDHIEPDSEDEPSTWTVWTFCVENCTDMNGMVSDNQFHPDMPAWFNDSLESIASYIGQRRDICVKYLLSHDPMERAMMWLDIGQYHGMENLDGSPRTYNKEEIEEFVQKLKDAGKPE